MNSDLNVIILAAGQGTRMKSDLPKVLHRLGDKPLLEHVIQTANQLGTDAMHVVYGHGGELVKETLSHMNVNWVLQAQQLGTGHAVEQAMPAISGNKTVLILYGDVPLISQHTLSHLLSEVDDNTMALLTAVLHDPSGYGRIIRDVSGNVVGIVEQKDAKPEQKAIKEINTGILAVKSDLLRRWLKMLENNNAQGEFYLTDIISIAAKEGIAIKTAKPAALTEIEGVNNKIHLAELERAFQYQQAERLMTDGVTLKDPTRFDLRGKLTAGKDVIIDVNVVFEGNVSLGDRVYIAPNCVIKDSQIGSDVIIHPNTIVEKSSIGDGCELGPFARLRPETQLNHKVKVGNFVEIKKSTVDENSKINHLSYVGDTTMGKRVNVGAGTITCNYDGAFKHQTIIKDDVFIGSDTQLVAPVEVGEGATIGAGSTITHDAPAGQLTLSRAMQKTRKGWKRPQKNK
ncbi:bifunctional UDP-N-acetylglucosamine diphosphorylase/glucosamine-1-phosphate N-acetyltransferase GlmU [Kaarinaea lacus]